MEDLIQPTLTVLRAQWARACAAFDARRRSSDSDTGVSTLEMVIIALGLMGIATVLIAAITVAVTRRTNQIQ